MTGKIIELLKGVDLFSNLDDTRLMNIAEVASCKKFSKQTNVLYEEDDDLQSLFLIAKGEAKVVLTSADGREVILALLGPGDFFGEMSLIDGEPRSASVRTSTESEIMVIRRQDFLAQMQRYPDLLQTLLIEMSLRLRKADQRISSLATLSVFGRIAGILLNLMESRGMFIHSSNGKQIAVIPNRPTHQELAELSGTTRESVSKVLQDLRKREIISIAGKNLYILEESLLKNAR